MLFSYNWLKEYLPNLPLPKKLAEILTKKAFEVEKLQKKDKDCIFEIDILPNRAPDCSGYLGLSREIASLLGKKIKELKIKFSETDEDIKNYLSLDIEAKKNLNVYYLRMAKNVKVSSSPIWFKKKLAIHGINSINNLVDAANLTMLETGQPVHVFDYDKISGKKIIVREAAEGEKFVSLENKKYLLPKGALVIADEKDVLALAGIKGGKKAEVSNRTKNIVIESANFSSPLILKTSKELNLITDAQRRFGAGLSPYFAKLGLAHVFYLIEKSAGGKILKNELIFENQEAKSLIYLPFSETENLLGEKINEKETGEILKRIYCKTKIIKNKKGKIFALIPPPWREDLKIKEDLIEEIMRIHGLEKIKPRPLAGEISAKRPEENFFLKEQIKETLSRAGFNEVYLYSFVGEEDVKFLNKESLKKIIEVSNFFRPDFRYLRPNLSFSLLRALCEAKKYSSSIYLFELSPVFSQEKKSKDTREFQKERLVLGSDSGFFELKGRLTSVFESLGLGEAEYLDKLNLDYELAWELNRVFHPLRTSLIKIKNQIIGVIGEPRQEVKKAYDLKGEIALAEIEISKFFGEMEAEKEYRPISKYPALYRDIAILVPPSIKVIEIQDIIERAAGSLLTDADLFDIYEDEKLANRKSLAFHLTFQSKEKTLSEREVDKIMEKIVKALGENKDYEVRR